MDYENIAIAFSRNRLAVVNNPEMSPV